MQKKYCAVSLWRLLVFHTSQARPAMWLRKCYWLYIIIIIMRISLIIIIRRPGRVYSDEKLMHTAVIAIHTASRVYSIVLK